MIRNDRLGDFMLAWPSFAALRTSLPSSQVHALVPAYTADLAMICPWLDGFVPDPGPGAGLDLVRRLRRMGFDAAIALFSTGRVALQTRLAGIPYRMAPATKAAQILYTHRVPQRRSRSTKPEWEYNLDLVHAFLADVGVTPAVAEPPFLQFPAEESARLRDGWCGSQGIDPDHFLVFVHPGSGGSAPNLSPESFARVSGSLDPGRRYAVVVTAGPDERPLAERVVRLLAERHIPAGILHSTWGMVPFARHLAFADLFLSGSTGPLHLAGALDRPTAAFYPRTPTASMLRWQTVNSPHRRLAFEPPPDSPPDAMESIDPDGAARRISRWLRAAAPVGPWSTPPT